MYNKIGIVGDKNTILAFKAIGLDVFYANTSIEARDTIKKMDKEGYAVIFLTENLLPELTDFLARYKTQPYPAIIPVPKAGEKATLGINSLKKDMEKAIGFNIIENGGNNAR